MAVRQDVAILPWKKWAHPMVLWSASALEMRLWMVSVGKDHVEGVALVCSQDVMHEMRTAVIAG